jgi:hypothetical protein
MQERSFFDKGGSLNVGVLVSILSEEWSRRQGVNPMRLSRGQDHPAKGLAPRYPEEKLNTVRLPGL